MQPAAIQACVEATVKALYQELGRPVPADFGPATRLFGGPDGFDSMTLVTLIADLEGELAERFGQNVVLADEKAMSARLSPFRRVDTLVALVLERLPQPGAGN